MACLVAIQHNPPLKSFYRRRLALAAVMRKLLTMLNATLHDNQPWALADS